MSQLHIDIILPMYEQSCVCLILKCMHMKFVDFGGSSTAKNEQQMEPFRGDYNDINWQLICIWSVLIVPDLVWPI